MADIDESITRDLTLRYMTVLVLLGLIAFISFISLTQVINAAEDSSERVNLAGRQRYLVERAVFAAQRVAATKRTDNAAVNQLSETLELLDSQFTRIVGRPNNPPPSTVVDLLEKSKHVAADVRDFIDHGHKFLRPFNLMTAYDPDLNAMQAQVAAGLPDNLDEIAQRYAQENESRMRNLLRAQGAALMATLLAMLISVVGVFLPMVKRIRSEIFIRLGAMESLRLAALVYETSSEAMVITDPKGYIITVNSAFTAVTGYSKAEVIGKSTNILRSGRHDDRFYKELWHSINATGMWKGEIWNRRKNGDIYPEWLTVNTVYNEDGTVSRRVALFSDITEEKKTQDTIWRQANFDHLTGLPNRRMILDRLEQEIGKASRTNLPVALMLVDLDRFKEVNDSLGHEAGDQLILETVRRFQVCVGEVGTLGRLGGDEFTVILSDIEDMKSIDHLADLLLKSMQSPYQLGAEQVYMSASIGLTLYPVDALEAQDLLKNAEQAMYEAKRLGRNRLNYFEPTMQMAALSRLAISNDLRVALSSGQFRVYYQPIVHLATNHIHKAEALIRWQHPSRGVISPAEFVPIAEETGLIVEIGEWVFQEVTRQQVEWRTQKFSAIQISVNKSPVQMSQPSLRVEDWSDHLAKVGLPGDSITVEITEGLLLEANHLINAELLHLRDAGIQVALDDFGTGYSSLSYLKKFHIDYIKIDQSFVRGLSAEDSNMALCEAIIVMAHKLGMRVIAEGIETQEQRDLLAAAGCDYGQGYLFSRPVPAEQFQELIPAPQSQGAGA